MSITIGLSMIVSDRPDELVDALESSKELFDYLHVTLVEYPGIDKDMMEKCRQIVNNYGGTTDVYRTDENWNYPHIDNFAGARNQSISHFPDNVDYIMWMDSDEILMDGWDLRQQLDDTAHKLSSNSMIYLKVKIDGGITTQARIWANYPRKWIGRVHEHIDIKNTEPVLLSPNVEIVHRRKDYELSNQRNEALLIESIKDNSATPREKYYYGMHRWLDQDYRSAVNLFEDVIEKTYDPESKYMAMLLTAQYFIKHLHEPQKAKSLIVEAMEINMNHYKVYTVMGDYFREMEMFRTAIQWYNMALNIPHDEWSSGQVRGWLINDRERMGYTNEALASCFLELGNSKRAIKLHAIARYYNTKLEINDTIFEV